MVCGRCASWHVCRLRDTPLGCERCASWHVCVECETRVPFVDCEATRLADHQRLDHAPLCFLPAHAAHTHTREHALPSPDPSSLLARETEEIRQWRWHERWQETWQRDGASGTRQRLSWAKLERNVSRQRSPLRYLYHRDDRRDGIRDEMTRAMASEMR